MKRILKSLLIISSIFLVFSCGSDDDSNSSDNASIVGTWKLTGYTINGVSYYDPNDCDDQETANFTSDNVVTYTYFTASTTGTGCQTDGTGSGTYSATDGQLTISGSGQSFGPYPYVVSNTTLTITYVEGGVTQIDTYTRQ